MTAFAGDASVCALQFEIGLHIVIKQPQVPGDRVVTGFAVALKNAIVIVVFQMAVDTGVTGIREELRFMAVLTLNVRVFTEQRKISQVVIEELGVRPLRFCMAIVALVTKHAFVRLILEMTGDTVSTRRHFKNRLCMTVVAGDGLVRSIQAKVGLQIVIEGGLFPCLGSMACTAVSTAMTRVAIIFQMAAGTGHIHDIIEWIFAVTIGT